jgi:hypothetical protein
MPGTPTAATRYEAVAGWAKIPHGIWLREATAVAVDSEDRVYVFNRGNVPMLVFDPDGNLVDSWGNETPHAGVTEIEDPYGTRRNVWDGVRYVWPHSVRVDPNDHLWLTDVHTHTMTKTTRGGDELMRIGTGERAATSSSATVTATRGCIATTPRAITSCRGASRVRTTGNSACRTTSRWWMTSM